MAAPTPKPIPHIGHQMVRASAGTGKTTSLTRRYVRLLCMGAKPESIVALTFTRKAAGEFFDRIAGMLAKASGDPEEAAKLIRDIQLHPSIEPDFPHLLRDVLARQHLLMLGTLDSFYARVVRSFPFELGVAGGFQVLDGYSLDVERDRALQGVFERVGQRQNAGLSSFLQAFKLATHGHEEVLLNRLLGEYVSGYHRILLDSPRGLRWGDAQTIWGPQGVPYPCATRAELEGHRDAFLKALTTNPEISQEKHLEKWRTGLDELIARQPGTALDVSAFLKTNVFPKLPEARKGAATITVARKKCALDSGQCRRLWAFFEGVLGEELRVRLDRAAGMQQLLGDFETIYAGTVRARGALTFDDLARLLGEVSSSRHGGEMQTISLELGYRLDSAFDHWLLDEFQDTSRVQWAALSDLIDEVVQDDSDQRSLFVVGDTKQAIYGWREGDARLFGEVLERYNQGAEDRIEEGSLDESYRSAPPVIETVNHVFGDRAAMELLFEEGAVSRWGWKKHTAAYPDRPGYAELLECRPEGVGATPQDKWRREQARLQVVATRLQEIRPDQQGISCAVLVGGNKFADRTLDFLRERCPEIQFSTESSRQIAHENHLCSALFSLVQLAAHPGDSLAWQHLRMTPLAEIFKAEGLGEPEEVSMTLLRELSRTGFTATLQRWIDRLFKVHPPDDFARLRAAQIVDAAGAYDHAGRTDPDAFLAALEKYEIRDAGGARTVQIMTVHKSKGLDFDMVILPDLDGDALGSRDRSGSLLVGRGEERDIIWAIEAPAGRLSEIDPVLAAQKESARIDEVYEGFCKLYVGMTRPRHGLYLVIDQLSKGRVKSGVLPSNFSGWLRSTLGAGEPEDCRVGQIPCQRLFRVGDESWPTGVGDKAEPVAVARLPVLDTPVSAGVPSPSPATGGATAIDPEAAALGSAVHELLAVIEWLEFDEKSGKAIPPSSKDSPARNEVEACLKAPAIRSLLTRPESPGAIEVRRELAFDLLLEGQWRSGIIDRLHLHRDAAGTLQRIEVIDFKTDRIQASGLPDALAQHRPQIASYQRAAAALFGIAEEQVEVVLVFTALGEVARS